MTIAVRIIVPLVGLVLAACTQSPMAPDAPSANLGSQVQLEARAVPGTYDISFLKATQSGPQPIVNTLGVGETLALKAEIRDSAGLPAAAGTVAFQVCKRDNDFAPSSACEGAGGKWSTLLTIHFDAGAPAVHFGSCSTPRTIGFRVRFSGQKTGIANGVSPARDVSWQ